MAAYLAPSLRALWGEVNARWPGRSRAVDGWIGDVSHQGQKAKSEHNPDPFPGGVVRATDTTSSGIDAMLLVLAAIAHPACYYVIYKGSIWSRPYGFRRRVYTGSNPHDHHVHISLLHTAAADGSTRPWLSGLAANLAAAPGGLLAAAQIGSPPAPDEETLMAALTFRSPLPEDDGKEITASDAFQNLLAQVRLLRTDLSEVRAELQEARDGRLGNDLRKAHSWLRSSFINLGNHLALPGDSNLPADQRALGGRFLRAIRAINTPAPAVRVEEQR